MIKRKEWISLITTVFVVWLLDRISKNFAMNLDGVQNYDWIIFSLHHNQGAMLGLFSDLPPLLRIVSLSTGGAFLVCTYALIQFLLPLRAMVLRFGMSILLGGILGNVADRIMYGHVVDFLIVRLGSYLSPAFNVSDALQWVGYALILYVIFRDSQSLWPDKDDRKLQWVKRDFQLKYCFILLGVGLAISLVALVFSYTFLRVTVITLSGENQKVLDQFLDPFAMTFTLLSIGFCVALFLVGKVLSHKMAGPLYSFEKHVNELIKARQSGRSVGAFQLRNNDEFKEFETMAEQIRVALDVKLETKTDKSSKSL